MSLITTFKNQNSKTIWETLRILAADNSVCSSRLQTRQIAPHGHQYYVYIQNDEIVFLLRDEHLANTNVLADEESFMDEPPLYFTENFHMRSPVNLVQMLCHVYKEVMRKTGWEAGKVHGVFLTNSNIFNREDMESLWQWLEVTVIDKVDKYEEITTAIGNLGESRERLMHFLENIHLATWSLDPQYDHVIDNYPTEDTHDGEGEGCPSEETHDGEREGRPTENTHDGEGEGCPSEETHDGEGEGCPTENTHDGEGEGCPTEETHDSEGEGCSTEETHDDDKKENPQSSQDQDFFEKMLKIFEEDLFGVDEEIDEDDKKEDDEEEEETPKVEFPKMENQIGVEIFQPVIHPWEKLNKLVGMEEIKKRILTLSMLAKYNNMLIANGAKAHKVSLHSIFYGNPGTGKTIVGRLYASILKEAGIISKGHVVLANGRQAFVGCVYGEEEKNVGNLLRLAQGGNSYVETLLVV